MARRDRTTTTAKTFAFAREAGTGRFQKVSVAKLGPNNPAPTFVPPSSTNPDPMAPVGVHGTAVIAGYIERKERNPLLVGSRRHETAADILTNISVCAAGLRYSLGLVAKAKIKVVPRGESKDSNEYTEFVESVMEDMNVPMWRVIRKAALFQFHGASIQEWTAKIRDDGRKGFASIDARPAHTIERWDVTPNGQVLGATQYNSYSGRELYIPRAKMIYIVDDELTDSPEGLGLFRHLVEPAERLKRYLKMEGLGFERDLSGVPIGRAPYDLLNKYVADHPDYREIADRMLKEFEQFIRQECRQEDTGLVVDSSTYPNTAQDGPKQSGVPLWDIQLLTGKSESIEALNTAIIRVNHDMARIIGTENLLLGADGAGSLALSEDKTNTMLMRVNGAKDEICDAFTRDFINPLWILNGFPEDQKPKLIGEDLRFDDALKIAQTLSAMATAGMPCQPDDEAQNDLRDAMGLTRVDLMQITEAVQAQAALDRAINLRGVDPSVDPNEDPQSTDPISEDPKAKEAA